MSSILTRRNFLKTAAAAGAASAAAPALAASSQSTAAPKHWDQTVDVVVLGAGGAGLMAACQVYDKKGKVVVFDKSYSPYHSATRMCGGLFTAYGSAIQKREHAKDSWQEFAHDIMDYGGYMSLKEPVELFAKHSGEAFDWLENHGLAKHHLEKYPGHSNLRAVRQDSYQGKDYIDVLTKQIADRKIKIYEGTPLTKIYFDPKKNELLSDGEAIRWIARDKKGEVVGRIAAFYDREHAFLEEQPTGGCGFFEAINDQELADQLFDAARMWLSSRGMEAMDGPINFGPRDSWWGLLVSGYEFQPLYENAYNPPYYKELFENYGFQNYFNQHTYLRRLEVGQLSDSVYERVKRLEESPGYCFKHISKKNLEQVAEDFRLVYNKAWALFSGVKAMDREQAFRIMNTLRPIIDERLVYFAYYNDEPIGFFIMVPDLNRVIGSFNGKFGWWNKLRLMWALKVAHKADRVLGLIFGVTPEFHGKGIEAGIIREFEKAVPKLPYKSLELAWIGDFNPVMMRMVESYVCATKHKMHTTYRYLFDRTKEFHRCPRMGVKRRE